MVIPVTRLRFLKRRSGIKALALRASMIAKAIRETADKTSAHTTLAACQPISGPSTKAKTSKVAPTVTVSAPGRSKLRCSWRFGSRGINKKAAIIANAS